MGAFDRYDCKLMRSGADHLPLSKQRELDHVVRVLFEEFEASLKSATQPWKKAGRILKVILYGSYARGDWVEDAVGGYVSDFDLLIIVNDKRLTDPVDFWSSADDRLTRELTISRSISAPVNFIVHSLTDLNSQLERGLPFFTDIVKQGCALYEAEGFRLAAPRILPPDRARQEAERHFERWFLSASEFSRLAQMANEAGMLSKSAFLLHQATEHFYHCVLLVLTLYSPKSHRLNFLRSLAEDAEPRLIEAWPRSTKSERRCFELLRQAYVNARYSPHFTIASEELEWLGERVLILQQLTEAVCRERLA